MALVTGASRGIGRAVCLALAREGAHVIGVARDEGRLNGAGAEVEAGGGRFMALAADLADPSVEGVVDRAWAWKGRVDILVNAAGVLIRGPEDDLTTDDWDRTLSLNARAPYLLMRAIGPRMRQAGSGAIVNVASIAGKHVTGAPAAYQASKAALIQLTRFFASRLAPQVRVNAVGPGYVQTELSAAWLADASNLQWVTTRTPLGRVGMAEEVAEVVAFVASDRASYITGQHVLVDGGWGVG